MYGFGHACFRWSYCVWCVSSLEQQNLLQYKPACSTSLASRYPASNGAQDQSQHQIYCYPPLHSIFPSAVPFPSLRRKISIANIPCLEDRHASSSCRMQRSRPACGTPGTAASWRTRDSVRNVFPLFQSGEALKTVKLPLHSLAAFHIDTVGRWRVQKWDHGAWWDGKKNIGILEIWPSPFFLFC